MSETIEMPRRLAAILAADVEGFARLTDADEDGTLKALASQRAILDGLINRYRGRIANTAGDSVLAEFPSVGDAVHCAVEAQAAHAEAAALLAQDRRVLFRIGIHVGDVLARGEDLLGNGVNVAARLQSIAPAGGVVISASAYDHVRKSPSFTFADLGDQRVKNLEEPVHAYTVNAKTETNVSAQSSHLRSDTNKPLALPDKPSIAVLPFQNMSGDPEQEYFADGMVEEIITALSRFKSLFVIARNSSFAYKSKSPDIRQVGRELGVRYVLEGSVRKAGRRLRITGQLIEAATGVHVWADKFEGALEDAFQLQDDISTSVVGAIVPQMNLANLEAALRKPPENWNCQDHYMRGRKLQRDGSNREAIEEFRKAINFDPTFARAYGLAALSFWLMDFMLFLPVSQDDRREAIRLAERAFQLASDDAEVLTVVTIIVAYFKKDLEEASILADRAIALNSNLSGAWNQRGWISCFLGDHELALDAFARALRLNPFDRSLVPNIYWGNATACQCLGRIEEALVWAQKRLPYHPRNGLVQVAILMHMTGRHAEAEEAARRFRELYPELRAGHFKVQTREYFRRRQDRELMDATLDLLGLPE